MFGTSDGNQLGSDFKTKLARSISSRYEQNKQNKRKHLTDTETIELYAASLQRMLITGAVMSNRTLEPKTSAWEDPRAGKARSLQAWAPDEGDSELRRLPRDGVGLIMKTVRPAAYFCKPAQLFL